MSPLGRTFTGGRGSSSGRTVSHGPSFESRTDLLMVSMYSGCSL